MVGMKTIVLVLGLLLVAGCGSEWWGCGAGEMQCDGNTAQMCSASNHWEDWQNCSAVQRQCTTDDWRCSGYSGIACCD